MATQVKSDAPDVQERQSKMAQAIAGIKPVDQGLGLFKGLFYAKNKIGKTQLAASSGLHTLIVETEPAGTETLATRGYKNVDFFQLNRWDQTEGLFWYLHTGDHPYEMVAIDTVSMWVTHCLRYVMGQETRLDPLMPKTDHWQKLAQIMNNEILRWVSLPLPVVFLAQERNLTVHTDDDDDTLQMIAPALNPASIATLVGAVGTIGHMFIKEVTIDGKKVFQRRMHFGPHPLYMAGTRVRGLPTIMANPTLAAIMDIRAKTGEAPPEDLALTASAVTEEDDEPTEQDAGVATLDI